MKLVPAGAAIALMLTLSPAVASHQRQWIERSVGQEIFNLNNSRVGRLEGYIDLRGTPGIIIATDQKFGSRKVIAPADDLGKRAGRHNSLLLALSNQSVGNLPTYQPGRLPVW